MSKNTKIDNLRWAIREANRFIIAALDAIKRLEKDSPADICGSRETATAKRASMDLSNALVAVRK